MGLDSRRGAEAQGMRWRPKALDIAPDESREWLIWSRYWNAWHKISDQRGACGYTDDIVQAGIFETRKAREYHDGVRNCAIHVSKVAKQLRQKRKATLLRHAVEMHDIDEKIALISAPLRETQKQVQP